MNRCTDTNIGKMIHAYEVGSLSEAESEQFELHLMECRFCFEKALKFADYADIIKYSPKAESLVNHSIGKNLPTPSFWRNLVKLLWPETPLLFRPGLLMALLVLVTVVWIGDLATIDQGIRPLQSIRFDDTRSGMNNILDASLGIDAVLIFDVPDINNSGGVDIIVENEKGKQIVRLDKFKNINATGEGEILFPSEMMKPGVYSIIIIADRPAIDPLLYRFKVIQ